MSRVNYSACAEAFLCQCQTYSQQNYILCWRTFMQIIIRTTHFPCKVTLHTRKLLIIIVMVKSHYSSYKCRSPSAVVLPDNEMLQAAWPIICHLKSKGQCMYPICLIDGHYDFSPTQNSYRYWVLYKYVVVQCISNTVDCTYIPHV